MILYQALTGKHPFVDPAWQGKTRAERRTMLFQNIRKTEYPPPEAMVPDLAPSLLRVIQHALRSDPKERYADGRAMLEDLAEAWREAKADAQLVAANPTGIESSTRHPAVAKQAPDPALSETASVAAPAAEPASEEESTEPPRGLADFGRYRLLREIGHGGQGVVYLAHDSVLERDVALKVLQASFHADQEMLALFRHEARVAARLNHPHIIPIFDFGVQDGKPYLIMPLIEGPSLDRLLGRHGALPVAFCLQILIQAADALAYAHRNGVVHLDVKPGNILLRFPRPGMPAAGMLEEPTAILTDFTMSEWFRAGERGNAQGLSETARRAGGTLPYAAPEQLAERLEAIGPASDFYALGVILHEMLTGKRLFDGGADGATRRLLNADRIEPPSLSRQDLHPAADAICLDLLAADPAKRLADPAWLLERTRRALRDCET
ncbi:MAG: serine/threonine-protein kinase [Planctomycetota bacterium]|nr:serine/threonine-protein kinase [Planctomycetota bacterium]